MDDETLRKLLGRPSPFEVLDAVSAASEVMRQDRALRDLIGGYERSATTAVQDALRDIALASPSRAFESFVSSSDYMRLADQQAMRAAQGFVFQDAALDAVKAYRSIDEHVLAEARRAAAFGQQTLLERYAAGELFDHGAAVRRAAMGLATSDQALEWAKMGADARALQAMIVPDTALVFEMAARAAQHTEIHRRLMADQEAWRGDLAWRMATITAPWAAADDPMHSAQAFGELAALADVISFDAPFDKETSARVRDELGEPLTPSDGESADARDRRRTAAGRNPALVAFPQQGYGQVIVSAGFSLIVPVAAVPPSEEAANLVFDPSHNAMVTHLEQHIRQLVQDRLEQWAGPSWLTQCVPQTMLKAWEERREQAREKARSLLPLIHYSDFYDLATVITGRANWRNVFQPIFHNKESLQVSFSRLHPIRNDLAHSRPLCQGDVLDLMAEASRLFRALGVEVLR